jgi:HAE1 family hydrophobic/amphiphilic exporter-1
MDIVKLSIAKPVSVAVGVILILMFGLIGLTAIPVQLTPTVDRPVITVSTSWPGRSPQEVVDEITKKQEEQLKNVANLRKMVSNSSEGAAEITLEFSINADINRALQEVSDSLRQVEDYPDEVDEPAIKAADGASENAIAWIITELPTDKIAKHPGFDITTLYDALDKEVKPYLERIEGVAEVNIYGGREREVRILADPTALAQRGLNHLDVVAALRGENRNVSAGTIAQGKRDYRVRLVGEFTSPDQILETIIAYRDGRPVYVRDVATVEIDHEKRRGFVRTFGHPALAMNVIRQSDANVVDVMEQVRLRLDDVRAEILPSLGGVTAGGPVGPDLRMRQVYDETTYIDSAVSLVTSNLYVGGAIAGVVLMVFLRAIRPTLIVMVAIPISVIGTFLVMVAMDRTLNVISLAGLAFAVGMVVDNAIVVLENIYRRMQLGEPVWKAAWLGGKEVWGAILASTLTTVAVFIPVLTIQEEAGQLFRDIALAVVASVVLSLTVSITVIPTASALFLSDRKPRTKAGRAIDSLFGLVPLLTLLNQAVGNAVRWMITGARGWTVRPLLIVVLTVLSVVGAVKLMPPMDYLPAGNRNLVFGGLLIPPGLSVEQRESIAQNIESNILPYANADIDDPSSVAELAPIFRPSYVQGVTPPEPFAPVPVDNFFIGAFGTVMFIGATSQDEQVVIPVGQLVTNAMGQIPDSFGGASQTSLFARGPGGGAGNTIDLEVSGPRLDRVTAAASFMFNTAAQQYGYGNVRPDPANFLLQEQELQVRLNDRGRELGLTNEALGVAIRALFDGAFVGDYKLSGETVDLRVLPTGGRLDYKEQLADIPIATPAGPIVPVDSVIEFVPSLAPQSIKRIEELESVSIQVRPPEGTPIEDVMEWLNTGVIDAAREAGLIDRTMRVRLEGTAAKLDEVRAALFGPPPDGSGPLPIGRYIAAVLGLVALVGVGWVLLPLGSKLSGRDWLHVAIGAALIAISVASAMYVMHDLGPAMTQYDQQAAANAALVAASSNAQTPPIKIDLSVPFLPALPMIVAFGILATAVLIAIVTFTSGYLIAGRALMARAPAQTYGAAGLLLLGLLLITLTLGVAASPALILARFVWALLVTYLLMCALFESFLTPLVIMFSVPLAIVGGFAGLRIVHDISMADPTIAPQQFDVLTMLGFVILIGVVVNNAILIVHQALNFMRGLEGDPMSPHDAIAESVRTRIRPIFMSVLTSVGGMLPLVLFPGPGSEMYRGLGSVVIGGLLVSTVFTLVLVPLLFSLVQDMQVGALAGLGLAGGRGAPDAPSIPRPTIPEGTQA